MSNLIVFKASTVFPLQLGALVTSTWVVSDPNVRHSWVHKSNLFALSRFSGHQLQLQPWTGPSQVGDVADQPCSCSLRVLMRLCRTSDSSHVVTPRLRILNNSNILPSCVYLLGDVPAFLHHAWEIPYVCRVDLVCLGFFPLQWRKKTEFLRYMFFISITLTSSVSHFQSQCNSVWRDNSQCASHSKLSSVLCNGGTVSASSIFTVSLVLHCPGREIKTIKIHYKPLIVTFSRK